MASFTRHPVGTPPQAPARESTRRLLLRAHAILALVVLLAAPALYLVFDVGIAAAIVALTSAGTIAWWVPRIVAQGRSVGFPWRRLPWAALGYLTFAGLSLIWSAWPEATALTWAGMLISTTTGLFLASTLSWREMVKVLASALKWVIGLSLLLELYVAVIVRAPIFPPRPSFVPPTGDIDPQLYWVRENLFTATGRIQGIVGNANLLAMICLIALIVFSVRLASKSRRRGWLVAWIVLTAYLFYRADSATAWLALLVAVAVLATVLIMRTAQTPRQRTLRYSAFFALFVMGGGAAILLRDRLFEAVGRGGDLTGRVGIWQQVLERAAEHPAIGWGFSSPWVPWVPGFDNWLVDHDQVVMQAHNMWIDVYFQLGVIGVLLISVVFAALLWRSWFFAVDRPRWDVVAHRPYARLSVLPILMTAVLLMQSLTESNPAMLWGWTLVIALSFKMKSTPIIGVGAAEQTIERGIDPMTKR